MNKQRKLLTLVISLAAAVSAYAQPAQIRKNLMAKMPHLAEISSISTTPVAGLFEVVVNNQIMYTDANGEYIFEGAMINVSNMKNITQDRLDVLNAVAWQDLPLQSAVTSKIGDGSRKLAVFADPNCGYCKKLQKESISKLKNVTVYTFVIPILSPDSVNKAKAIACAKDKSAAWRSWMMDDVPPMANPGPCASNEIDAAVKFAQLHRIVGTPTIFFPNGRRIASALPLTELDGLLSQSQ